jgi:lipopolysaccharide/colanic/teichoic acid biosynthesis glycosyltransferase
MDTVYDTSERRQADFRERAAIRTTSANGAFVKRAFDFVFASAVLVLSSPLLIALIVAIRLESPGPALFRQERMGRGGRRFTMVKLRGMYVDARERFPELYDYASIPPDDRDSYFFHTGDGRDPRVTRVGRFVRRTSLDELPNFWNVLRGDMSVVGPRPEIPELAHLYGRDLDLLLSVKPGVTSPAKATGRDELSFSENLEQELTYIRERSIRLDLATIARTALSVLRTSGVR